MALRKPVYRFAKNAAEGRAAWKQLLGGKGANLAEMANLGIPVPPGFTITTEVCTAYHESGHLPDGVEGAITDALEWLESQTGKRFGDPSNPLLLSVRSGARVSMPGMMDTVLDLGLNDETIQGLIHMSGSERFGWDAYRRFVQMYGDVVLDVPRHRFDDALAAARRAVAEREGMDGLDDREGLARRLPDSQLPADALQGLVGTYKSLVEEATGEPFPDDPEEQLLGAITAVFKSWDNDRAKLYRKLHGYPSEWGTAVNVQTMVFGNLGDTSATGVAFTRDPATGEPRFYGEWLQNAQGEDVVAGVRTPRPLLKINSQEPGDSLEEAMPRAFEELFEYQKLLETHYRDMQDLEFTIEDDVLWMLQTRTGKRTARSSVRIAVDMVHEGMIREEEALMRIEPNRLTELLFPAIDPKAGARAIAEGIAASPGAVTGIAVFDADEAEKRAEDGTSVILVRTETSPEDLRGMKVASGIVTARGGATSHAAVVARGMGRSCVAGCSLLAVNEAARRMVAHAKDGTVLATIAEGQTITIDGSEGKVYAGDVPKVNVGLGDELATLLEWAAKIRGMTVRANADTPEQAEQAYGFGAKGIGLCRTEHMFFGDDRIDAMRAMILANSEATRRQALGELLPFQTEDFIGMFRAMKGYPVNIRLLDPPLHEFLPQASGQIDALANKLGVSASDLLRRSTELHEANPMLGHRGVRLAVTYPEIAEMQIRAILTAAARVKKEGGHAYPEIMVPLAFSQAELQKMRKLTKRVAEEVFEAEGTDVEYQFGTMIELPRAALLAHELAEEAAFFSFGTNDLTQTTLGVSRDDAGKFLPTYVAEHILSADPFVSVDTKGVGRLLDIACDGGRRTRPSIKVGVCGEHGGDPDSVAFFDTLGIDYVSCSPFRVPIARLAAAQAVLRRLNE
jgi:pyruvate,orthophosphate dikinase